MEACRSMVQPYRAEEKCLYNFVYAVSWKGEVYRGTIGKGRFQPSFIFPLKKNKKIFWGFFENIYLCTRLRKYPCRSYSSVG